MIRSERLTSNLEGEFVVFLIGLRINKPLMVHKWWPVTKAMPRMLEELNRQPELGFLHAEMWFSRTTIMVQYWRSMEQLLAYARNKTAEHLPAWQAFNKAVGTNGSVGIWHETYAASPGTYENMYVNMPPFGLGKAGTLGPATGGMHSAVGRLSKGKNAPQPFHRGDAQKAAPFVHPSCQTLDFGSLTLTTQSSEAALAFLQKKWGNRTCPMCGTGQWTVQDKVFQLTEYHSGNVVLGGPIVPVIPVSCTNCGNTVLVNAIIAGAVKSDGSLPEAAK